MKIIKCVCGCGKTLTNKDKYGRTRTGIPGHNRRNKKSGKDLPCDVCGKIIYRKQSLLKNRKYTLCSRACVAKLSSIVKWSARYGKDNYRFKGRFLNSDGYVVLSLPNHPLANKAGLVYEHRLVMFKILGRVLHRYEDIHHIDSDKTNNHPDNLLLIPKSKHAHLHWDTSAYSKTPPK